MPRELVSFRGAQPAGPLNWTEKTACRRQLVSNMLDRNMMAAAGLQSKRRGGFFEV
jgi:hypothetical protein